MSGMTSQPSVGSFLASLEGTGLEAGLDVDHVRAIDEYWAQIRLLYSCFEADLKGPDNEVYVHEIPGGQLTNLKFQATQLGLGTQWLGTPYTKQKSDKRNQESLCASKQVIGRYCQGHTYIESCWRFGSVPCLK
jgi:pyruvate carboxylase